MLLTDNSNPPVALAVVLFILVVLLLFIYCLLLLPLFVKTCFVLRYFVSISSFAIISLEKIELVPLLVCVLDVMLLYVFDSSSQCYWLICIMLLWPFYVVNIYSCP